MKNVVAVVWPLIGAGESCGASEMLDIFWGKKKKKFGGWMFPRETTFAGFLRDGEQVRKKREDLLEGSRDRGIEVPERSRRDLEEGRKLAALQSKGSRRGDSIAATATPSRSYTRNYRIITIIVLVVGSSLFGLLFCGSCLVVVVVIDDAG